jgi:hypothetical protein
MMKEGLTMRIDDNGPLRKRLYFGCPRRPGTECSVLLKPWPISAPTWDWDGNEEAPTLLPSINCNGTGGCGWHGFIKAGKLIDA